MHNFWTDRQTDRQTDYYIKGFTLAEVLVTLVIIGVIAALTIPNAIIVIEEIQTAAGVKEAYSIMNQALLKLRADHGGTVKGLCNNNDHNCMMNIFKPYLITVKSCNEFESFGNCRVQHSFMDGTPYTNDQPSLVLNNGMIIEFKYRYKDCSYTNASTTSNSKCGWFSVDINGFKGPNRYGKDVFWFSLQEYSIKPGGSQGDYNNYLNCTGTETGNASGLGCTAKYIINY